MIGRGGHCLHAHIELNHLCQLFDGLLKDKLSVQRFYPTMSQLVGML